MDRVAGLDSRHDLLRIAVDQRDLAGVAQRHREDIVEIDVVHLLLRPLGDRNDHLPRGLHLLHAEFRRGRRLVEEITRHQVDLLFRQIARGAPVRHAGGRTIGDEVAQIFEALRLRQVGCQRLAGGALAQHAVTARATLEVDLVRGGEFFRRQFRIAWFLARLLHLVRVHRVEARHVGRNAALVAMISRRLGGGSCGGRLRLLCVRQRRDRRRSEQCRRAEKSEPPQPSFHLSHVTPSSRWRWCVTRLDRLSP